MIPKNLITILIFLLKNIYTYIKIFFEQMVRGLGEIFVGAYPGEAIL